MPQREFNHAEHKKSRKFQTRGFNLSSTNWFLLLNQHVNLVVLDFDNAAFNVEQLLAMVGVVFHNTYLAFAQSRYYRGVAVQYLKRTHNAKYATSATLPQLGDNGYFLDIKDI